MKGSSRLFAITLLATACATTPPAAKPPAPSVSPADLVAAVADEAAGRNPAMAEAGLLLRTIEFRLLVGTTTSEGASVTILVLDAGASASVESSFLQSFTLEIPPSRTPRVAAAPAVAGVAEFVDAAMNAARDLARAAKEQGLPHRLAKVELEASIERSRSGKGGVAFTLPTPVAVSVDAGGSSTRKDANTIKLVFVAAERGN